MNSSYPMTDPWCCYANMTGVFLDWIHVTNMDPSWLLVVPLWHHHLHPSTGNHHGFVALMPVLQYNINMGMGQYL